MMWVRFPNGQCIQYNQAGYVARSQFGYTDIYTKKDGVWIAQVPNTCVIEVQFACRVWNPLDNRPDDTATAKELRSLKRKLQKGAAK
jgi:hypothetical protein